MDLEAIKYAILSFLEKVQPFFPFVLGFDIALTCYNEIFKEETTSIMKGCDIILSLVAICLTFSQDNLIVMLNTAIIISITICKLIAIFSKQIVIEEEEFI